ncbi:MAG: ubiquinol-cytochrome C chaperone family protein [Terricaulis sp.]
MAAITQISRQPAFFGEGRVADTLEGRLEVMTLHACLALMRIARDEKLAPLGQAFADVLFRHFDAGLREAGVGDTAVPKRMRKIAGSFYGRLDAYAAALAAPESGPLGDAIARNMLGVDEAPPYAAILSAYVRATATAQAPAPVDALFRLDGWQPAPA